MNLGKIKTFLIILFLGINVYLVISLILSSEFRIDEAAIEDTVSVLRKSGIEIDGNVIPKKAVNLRNIETKNIIYTDDFEQSGYYNLFSVENGGFKGNIQDSSLYNFSDKHIKRKIRHFLDKCGFDTGFMKFTDIQFKDGKKYFSVKCFVKGYEVFDNIIDITVDKSGFELAGRWNEPQSKDVKSNSKSRKQVYITSVLVDLTENSKAKKNIPFKIKEISVGYVSDSLHGSSGHISATALPYYKITDSENRVYYYDAVYGTYTDIK